jgi:DinB family protein
MQNVIEDFKNSINDSYDRLMQVSESASGEPMALGKWSRKELIGHLIDSASNNHQRFVRAQMEDGLALPGYAQEAWVERQGYKDESWANLAQFWKSYNQHLLRVVSRIPDDRLNALCAIGGSEPVTLRFVIEDYVSHMKHHLKQILGD